MSTNESDSQFDQYVTAEMAAKMLGVTYKTVHRHIESQEIPAEKWAGRYRIKREDVENFTPRIAGRPRTRMMPWRFSPSNNALIMSLCEVKLRDNVQEEDWMRALKEIQQSGDHEFMGTIARYIFRCEQSARKVQFQFVWRAAIKPSDKEYEALFDELRVALADVCDWATARFETCQIDMHT